MAFFLKIMTLKNVIVDTHPTSGGVAKKDSEIMTLTVLPLSYCKKNQYYAVKIDIYK